MSFRSVTVALGCFTMLFAAVPANASVVKNGNFETGTLAKWRQEADLSGEWRPYGTGDAVCGHPAPPPLAGTYSALTEQYGPSREVLYQDLRLPEEGHLKLLMRLTYASYAVIAAPNTLDVSVSNQQFRVDVLREGSSPWTMSGGKILKTVFETNTGDPPTVPQMTARANLSKYRGEEVRLRLAVAATDACLTASVDAIKVKVT